MFNLACILSLDIGASHATDAFIFCFELLTILKKVGGWMFGGARSKRKSERVLLLKKCSHQHLHFRHLIANLVSRWMSQIDSTFFFSF